MLLKNQSAADTKVVVDRDTHAIILTRMFAAPREQVFEAWTRPEHVTCWWDPAGDPLAECEIDLRPGGASDSSLGIPRRSPIRRRLSRDSPTRLSRLRSDGRSRASHS